MLRQELFDAIVRPIQVSFTVFLKYPLVLQQKQYNIPLPEKGFIYYIYILYDVVRIFIDQTSNLFCTKKTSARETH